MIKIDHDFINIKYDFVIMIEHNFANVKAKSLSYANMSDKMINIDDI